MTDWREGHKSECKKLIAEKSKIKYEMGGVEVPGPGDPRWANPTPADREAARQALASGMRPEDATNGGNPMLGGHMLGLEMEAMLDAPGGDEPASQESLDELADMVAQLQERRRSPKKKPPPAECGYTAKTVFQNGKPVIKLSRDPSTKSNKPEGPPPSGRRCSKCEVYKEEGDFSGKQWKLGRARKCKACVVPG
mmetsp:Transcript_98007/g.280369  ORF Transcript_98007/g.280369 Transcript_98007/m.280369 type:complete len:195 (+) Transcript_98007:396-980(+)